MSLTIENAVLDEVLEPVARCFTPDVAQRIASLKASPALQARLDDLAQKSNEGTLTLAERANYEAFVEAVDFVAILQAKARDILANHPVV